MQIMVDLPEDPGIALCRASNHQAIHAGTVKNLSGLLRRGYVAIRNHRYAHPGLDFRRRLILRRPAKTARAGTTMHGQHADAGLLGDMCDSTGVALSGIPAGAYL